MMVVGGIVWAAAGDSLGGGGIVTLGILNNPFARGESLLMPYLFLPSPSASTASFEPCLDKLPMRFLDFIFIISRFLIFGCDVGGGETLAVLSLPSFESFSPSSSFSPFSSMCSSFAFSSPSSSPPFLKTNLEGC